MSLREDRELQRLSKHRLSINEKQVHLIAMDLDDWCTTAWTSHASTGQALPNTDEMVRFVADHLGVHVKQQGEPWRVDVDSHRYRALSWIVRVFGAVLPKGWGSPNGGSHG